MIKINIYLLIAVMYMGLMVGLALGMVGTVPECNNEPVSWLFPIGVFVLMGTVLWLGWLARRETEK
jgi:hypothetical protein